MISTGWIFFCSQHLLILLWEITHWSAWLLKLEQFPIDCCKTKTNDIILANYKAQKNPACYPLKTWGKYTS